MISLLQDEQSHYSNMSTSSGSSSHDNLYSDLSKPSKNKSSSTTSEKLTVSGKRKRKTERDLTVLREELKKELMWSRDKISALSERLGLNETQIYKWWWDQTRKRAKRLQKEQSKKVGKQVLNLE